MMKRKLDQNKVALQADAASIAQCKSSREAAFGLWKGRTVVLPGETEPLPADGLAYQERMRAEWVDRGNRVDVDPNGK
jgi:hypothetical protein